MTSSSYKWSDSFDAGDVDPAAAGEAIERLGETTPEGLVEAARLNNVLAPLFEWDDAVAAQRQRLTRAREVLGALVVVVKIKEDTQPKVVKAFVKTNKHTDFRAVDPLEAARLAHVAKVGRGWADLEAWFERYNAMPEFEYACAAIRVALKRRDERQAA